MRVTYKTPPIEGRKFEFVVHETKGIGRFTAFLRGEVFWSKECDDPPCHEQLRVPRNIAGETLLIELEDDESKEELVFIIKDDGKGVAIERERLRVR